MRERPVISVIIVSYNTRAMTLECLASLYADLGSLTAEVWVVDNASTDGSTDAVRSAFPQVRVIANTENVGFGAANNQAMRQAAGAYLLLLNSDAFPKCGAVSVMVAFLDRHPEAGLVGPRLLNKDGSLQRSCYPFPSPSRAWLENLWISAVFPDNKRVGDYRRWAHDSEREVDWLIGACMLVRRDVFEQVGGFDERFFMYAEESDWQRRMRDAGWKILFTPAAQVVHLGGASGADQKAKINRHFFESLDYYEYKHHGVAGLVSLRAAMVVGCFIRALLWTVILLFVPKRRPLAASKAKLQSWLVVRQMTQWPRFT